MKDYSWIVEPGIGLPDILSAPLLEHGDFISLEQWRCNTDGKEKYAPKNKMLILDCTCCMPEDLKAYCKDTQEMLENDQPVLLYQPTARHKAVLAEQGIINTHIASNSLAMFIEPQRNASGDLRIALAEHLGVQEDYDVKRTVRKYRAGEDGFEETVKQWGGKQTRMPDYKELQPFIDRIRHSMHTLVAKKKICVSDEITPNDPPSSVPGSLWYNTPINVYVVFTPCGSSVEDPCHYAPPTGSITMEELISVGVYYDNKKYSEPVQWAYVEHSGHVSNKLQNDSTSERGWSTGFLALKGENASSPDFVSNTSSPNSVNGETQYTSSTQFKVGLSAGTQGITGDIGYSIGSSETCAIKDWTVLQESANSWWFYQQQPYDGRIDSFPDGCLDKDGVTELKPISKSTLAFNTQSVWIHNPAQCAGSRTITYEYGVGSHFVWYYYKAGNWTAWHWYHSGWTSRTLFIDFSRAFPK